MYTPEHIAILIKRLLEAVEAICGSCENPRIPREELKFDDPEQCQCRCRRINGLLLKVEAIQHPERNPITDDGS